MAQQPMAAPQRPRANHLVSHPIRPPGLSPKASHASMSQDSTAVILHGRGRTHWFAAWAKEVTTSAPLLLMLLRLHLLLRPCPMLKRLQLYALTLQNIPTSPLYSKCPQNTYGSDQMQLCDTTLQSQPAPQHHTRSKPQRNAKRSRPYLEPARISCVCLLCATRPQLHTE
jgi:hypothetical protein